MLYTIAVILLVLWLLGLMSGYTIGAAFVMQAAPVGSAESDASDANELRSTGWARRGVFRRIRFLSRNSSSWMLHFVDKHGGSDMPDDHDPEHTQASNEALRVAAENARDEAERFRRLAEEAREVRDQHREALESLRQEQERLRTIEEAARQAGEAARVAAEAARDATMSAVHATAETLHATLESMKTLEEMRKTLRDIRDLNKLDSN